MRPASPLALLAVASSALALSLSATREARSEGAIRVTSPAFANGGAIPSEYSCDGRGVSPPLHWSGLPPDTKSIAVVVDDPDAPHGPFVHWVLYNLPAATTELPADAAAQGALPAVASTGKWAPVCPPRGASVHHYHFKVLALRDPPGLALQQPSEDELMKAVRGHVLASGEMIGTYQRK
jgi:Raf kinase inhibitor-like YbhB/YbcL family protein